jgi:hypothetical protein
VFSLHAVDSHGVLFTFLPLSFSHGECTEGQPHLMLAGFVYYSRNCRAQTFQLCLYIFVTRTMEVMGTAKHFWLTFMMQGHREAEA